jgi:outer membrane protein assembly factor BamB
VTTIRVECPHCESRFQLSADLLGKSMRCPNADCREVFVVAELRDPAPAPIPIPAASPPADEPDAPTKPSIPAPATVSPRSDTGAIGDFVPVFEAEPVADDRPKAAPLLKAAALSSAPILKAEPILPATQIVAGPREVQWGGHADPFPPTTAVADPDDDIPIRTRPTRSNLPKVILFTLVSLVVLILAGVGGAFMYRAAKAEEEASADAELLYKDGKFGEARKRYDELQTEYPGSPSREKYRFFGELASLKGSITAVTTRENYSPAVEQLQKFLVENGDSPFAQPNTGYGADVVQAGQLLCDAVNGHAGDRLKAFRGTRANRDELTAAERAIADGRGLIPPLEKFRDKGGQSFDKTRAEYDATEAEVFKERARLKAIDPWRELATDPTDPDIERFEKEMRAAGLAGDAEVLKLSADAKVALRKKVRFTPDRRPPIAAPDAAAGLTAFAPRVYKSPAPKPGPEGTVDTVFAVARGVLYVLDAHTGAPLWAERVATDQKSADVPLRFVSEDGSADWLIVPALLDAEAGLTARQTRTGLPVWHQPLPAPALGRPVRIGGRLFVAIKDELGSVLQFDLATGEMLGRCEIRQPIGGGLAAFRGTRSGHGFLAVPAAARRVYLFEVGKEDGASGRVLPPRVVRVLATEHPEDSIKGEPLLIDPDDPTAPRRAVFAQGDLPTTMKLRSFALPPLAELGTPQPDAEAFPEAPAEVTVSGWAAFPPVSDGERVAVATDSGAVAVFGLNQPGNGDKPLFQLPGKQGDGEQAAVARGLVVSADEDTFWVVAGGQLAKLRAAVDPSGGYRLTPGSTPLPVGEPVSRGSVRPALNLGFVTTKTADSDTIHMTAFDLGSGEVAWKRQLGVSPVSRPLPFADGTALVVDRNGGAYRLTGRDDGPPTVEEVTSPLGETAGAATVAVSADGKRHWVVIPDAGRDEQRLIVRSVVDGKLDREFTVTTPAALAGNPAVLGERLVVPLANGYLYRFAAGDAKPTQGPLWRGPTAPAEGTCHLTAAGDAELLATDGGRRLLRWKWAADPAAVEKTGGPWEAREPITGPAVAFPSAGGDTVLVPDAGGVSAFEAGRPTVEPVRRWKGDPDRMIPGGRASHLTRVGDRVAYVSDGRVVVGLDPAQEKIEWAVGEPAADVGEVVGVAAGAGTLLVSYLSGQLVEIEMPGGKVNAEATRPAGHPLISAGASILRGRSAVVPAADGTVSVIPLVPRP